MCALLITVGCAQRSYEFDFSNVQDFQWDGKLTVTQTERARVGPFLTIERDWAVNQVKLKSLDGRVAFVDMNNYRGAPRASVGLPHQTDVPFAETGGPMRLMGVVLLADPARVIEELKQAKELADRLSKGVEGEAILPTDLKRPLTDHAEQMSLGEWWAVAMYEVREVTLRYELPEENLYVIMRDDRHSYGPAVMEVWANDGRLLREFEREQIPVSAYTDNDG